MMAHLRLQPLIALDTESDSFFRYTPRICLIQISTPAGAGCQAEADPTDVVDYLVDPLQLADLGPLGTLLADPSVQVILHAAENDVFLLQREYGFRITNIFDTQLAARILGRRGVGLAAMLEEEFGVVSDKRMQRTDWGRRPLTPQQMTYAQIDTHYLPALRCHQIERLEQAGRWREAQDAFQALELLRYEEPAPRTVWSMKRSRDVRREQTGVLAELWRWREDTAQRLNLPPVKIIPDRVLIELTQRAPATFAALRKVPGLAERQVQRYGKELLAAVERGQARPLPELPTSTPRPDQLLDDQDQKLFNALRQWRSQVAASRGVDPDIVFSNHLLLQIVEKRPQTIEELASIPAVGPWKAETYGPAILQLVGRHGKE